ncbi:MAG: thymidylate synthase [Candidatus Dojkabacteria bacterium]
MDWPIYFKDKLHIANKESNIGIVTLWTPMQAILPNLNPEQFSIGGQLYSKRGINFIIRNILANPIIDTIIICGANRSESAEALMAFIDQGIDENNNVIGVDKAPVDKEIEKDSIEEMRKRVKYIDMIGNSSFKVVQTKLDEISDSKRKPKQWSKPKTFPDPEPVTADKFPSEKTTYTVRGGYIKEVWPQVIRNIMKFGNKVGMIKVGEVKELLNIVTVIEDEDPYKPDIPEWFNFNKEDLQLYYKGFFEKTQASEDYGYGARMFSHPLGIPNEEYKAKVNTKTSEGLRSKDSSITLHNSFTLNQIAEVYEKLKNYKYDRGAVISIWNPWVDNVASGWMSDKQTNKSGNVPCMTQLQFAYRNHKLMLTAYFRSNDMFDAWPRNTFALRKLQFDLAKKLGMRPGYLTIISSLGQIYETNFDEAKKLLERYNNITNCRPDQRGVVIIEIDGDDIVVKHLDPSGNEVLEEFRTSGKEPKAAQKMSDILMTNLVFLEMPHAMDIARELQKAEIAIKNKLKFVQDQELKIN